MALEARVEEWLRKMGFNGEIPSSLPKICNPSTGFVWEQLISNVKPRQEIRYMKNNIIVNRLSKKTLQHQDQFSYPIKEIQVYMEKLRLEKQIRNLEKAVEEKQVKVDELLNKNKVTYVTIDNIKARIRENNDRTFLLDSKSKMIETEIQNAQEVLMLARNLTPVEMDATTNQDEIGKILEQCAEKLQKHLDTVSLPKTKNKSLSTSSMKTSRTPKYSRMNTFSRYLNQSTVLNDIAPSCRKHNYRNKENVHLLQPPTTSRRLKFSSDLDEKNNIGDHILKIPRKESLGILSPDSMNISDEIDTFLDSNEFEKWTLQPLSDSSLESREKRNELLQALQSHQNVKELLANLLHQNNRYLIVNQCKNVYLELFRKINVSLMECGDLISMDNAVGEFDLTELYFKHIEAELEKEKCRLLIKKRHDLVKRKKEDILFQLSNRIGNKQETRRIFEFQIEQAYMTGANNFLREEINSSKKMETGNEIELLNLKIKQMKEEIMSGSGDIKTLVSNIFKVFEDIRKNREETTSCVRSLNPYVHNLNWAAEMKTEVMSEEVAVFKKFPLEFNRRFKNNECQLFYRDISDTTIPSYIKVDSNHLAMIASLINAPYASAENVIFDLFRTKAVGKKLQSMGSQMESFEANYKKYTLETLNKREDYLQPVINKLECIINSKTVKDVLLAPSAMEEVTLLWQEMPFRNYISEKRQVDGYGYVFYEKKLEELKNN